MIIWKHLSVLLLLLLLLSVPIYSDVVLTDGEWAELEIIWTELETLTEEQAQELAFQKIQLTAASQKTTEVENSLKEAELSLTEYEKEQKRKTVVWVVGSLLAGVVAGIIFE